MGAGGAGAPGKDVAMKRSICRAVLGLLLVVVPLALPATALAGDIETPGRVEPPTPGGLAAVLQALLAPLVWLWDDGRITIDPNGAPAPASAAQAGDPGPVEDGRLGIDPNG
jgi:hypothetical protein